MSQIEHTRTHPLDCDPAPAAPCVAGGGCGCQWQPPRAPLCLELRVLNKRGGGSGGGRERSEEFPVGAQVTPGDRRHLGVPTPPTKRRERESKWTDPKDDQLKITFLMYQ